jgi:4-amino-4-deoxy-L-arabinose transferase-like glycosyltransferase
MPEKQDILERIRQALESPSRRKIYLLALIVVSGLAFRIHVSQIYPLWNDEAITANAAIAVKNLGLPIFQSGYEYWRSFPYTFAVSLSSHLFGNSELALRIPSIIFSGLSVILTYRLAGKIYSPLTGLTASAVMFFSAYHIAWSTQVRAYIMFQLVYLAAVYLIYLYGETGERKYLSLLFAAALLAIYINITGYIIPFIFLTYYFYISLYEKQFEIRRLVLLTVLGLIFLVLGPLSPESIFDWLSWQRHNPRFYYTLLFSKIPLLLCFSALGLFTGIKDELKPTFLLLASVLPASLIFILFVEGVSPRYLFFTVPFLAILAGNGIERISVKLSGLFDKEYISVGRIAAVLTIALVLFGLLSFTVADFRPHPADKSVYEHLDRNAGKDDAVITQWTPVMVYYFRPPDYVLYGDKESVPLDTRQDYIFNGSELYSGADFIDTAEGLEEVIRQNERGWLVLTEDSYERKSPEVKEVISSLDRVGDFEGYRMWKWNNSVSTP